MNQETKKIMLTETQKRKILDIFIYAREHGKNDSYIKERMKSKLNEFMPGFSEDDFNTIFDDCKTYITVNNMFYMFIKGEHLNENNGTDNQKKHYIKGKRIESDISEYCDLAKEYIAQQYIEYIKTDPNFFEDRRIEIDGLEESDYSNDFVNIFLENIRKYGYDQDLIKDMATVLYRKVGGDVELDEVKALIKTSTMREDIKYYIISILKGNPYEVSREQLIAEMEEDGLSEERKEKKLRTFDKKENLRRKNFKRLVSDEQAMALLRGMEPEKNVLPIISYKPFLAQTLAEEYIFDSEGNIKVENSLVLDKLLTIYLETKQYDEFEDAIKGIFGFDPKTVDLKTTKIPEGANRVASKYINYLSGRNGINQPKLALDIIENNLDMFGSDFVIMNQWHNIINNFGYNKEKLINIAQAIIENYMKTDEKTGKRVPTFDVETVSDGNMKFLKLLASRLKDLWANVSKKTAKKQNSPEEECTPNTVLAAWNGIEELRKALYYAMKKNNFSPDGGPNSEGR